MFIPDRHDRYSTSLRLFLCIVVCAVLCRTATALSPEEFRALPDDEQRSLLFATLEQRQLALRSVEAIVTMQMFNARYERDEIGEVVERFGSQSTHYWRLGDSYRLSVLQQELDGKQLFTSESGYDATKGASRMLANHRDVGHPTATISMRHDPIVKRYWYGLLLGGWLNDSKPSYLQYLLDHREDVQFEIASDTSDAVAVSVGEKYQPDGGQPLGLRRMWLEPAKGFLLTRLASRWERQNTDGDIDFEEWRVRVTDSKEVNGLWVPTAVEMVVLSDRMPTGVVTVHSLNVEEIRIGDVEEKDLVVEFPDGTEVNDTIEGRISHVGTTPFPKAAPPTVVSDEPRGRRLLPWLIGVNCIVLGMGILAYFLYRR